MVNINELKEELTFCKVYEWSYFIIIKRNDTVKVNVIRTMNSLSNLEIVYDYSVHINTYNNFEAKQITKKEFDSFVRKSQKLTGYKFKLY